MVMDVALKSGSKGMPEPRPVPTIKKVGVIGAGQMGSGIAHVIALGKYDVMLNDIRKESVDRALALIEKNLGRQAAKGVISMTISRPTVAHPICSFARSTRRVRYGDRGCDGR